VLTASGIGGSNTSAPQTITVNAAPVAPVASFTMDTATGTAPLTVNFTSTSTGDFDTLTWSFVDAANNVLGTANGASTSFTFPTAGTYAAVLTASGIGGSNTSAPQTITVNAAPVAPVASFTMDTATGTAPLTVNFTSTSTGDFDTLTWSFVDAANNVLGTANGATTSFTFPTAGTYAAVLTASGIDGSNTSAPQTITVNAAPVAPAASFTMDTTTGTAPLTVNFTSTSTGDFDTLTWSFVDAANNVLGTANGATTSFTFPTAGTYTAVLSVSGLGGTNTSAPQTITVNAAAVAPVASFTMDTTTGTAPLTVNFTSTSTGDFNTLTWSFKDAANNEIGTANSPTTSFTFPTAGIYTTTLTVDGLGGSNMSAPQTITVDAASTVPVPPPINHPLVFVSDRSGNNEIYIMGTDGVVTNISNNPASDTSPAWSADGSRIAFVSDRDGNDEIYVMNSDGSNVIRLTDNQASDETPMWTSAGGIVFATSRDGNYEIYSMNADGSNPVNVTNAPSNETNPAPAPDNSRIAYMSDRDANNEIYTTASNGTVANITNSPATDTSPSWENGSQSIVFVSDRESLAQLSIMGADGSNPTRISDLSKPDTHPAWSHDGSQIAFVSQDNGLTQIYIVKPDGTGVTKVSDGTANDSSPSWKP
jgi:Tol biopolymer transport system component/plastocyanin